MFEHIRIFAVCLILLLIVEVAEGVTVPWGDFCGIDHMKPYKRKQVMTTRIILLIVVSQVISISHELPLFNSFPPSLQLANSPTRRQCHPIKFNHETFDLNGAGGQAKHELSRFRCQRIFIFF